MEDGAYAIFNSAFDEGYAPLMIRIPNDLLKDHYLKFFTKLVDVSKDKNEIVDDNIKEEAQDQGPNIGNDKLKDIVKSGWSKNKGEILASFKPTKLNVLIGKVGKLGKSIVKSALSAFTRAYDVAKSGIDLMKDSSDTVKGASEARKSINEAKLVATIVGVVAAVLIGFVAIGLWSMNFLGMRKAIEKAFRMKAK